MRLAVGAALAVGAVATGVAGAGSVHASDSSSDPAMGWVDDPRMQAAIRAAERRETNRRAERSSPAAREARARSRTAYSGLGSRAALDAARQTHRGAVVERAWHPLRLPAGQRVADYLSSRTALIDRGAGQRPALVHATEPLAVEGSNEWKPVDLNLVEAPGGGWRSRRPVVPVDLAGTAAEWTKFEDLGLGLRPVGEAPGEAGLEVEGKIFYPNVDRDTDWLITPVAGGVETVTVLRSQESPEELFLEFDLPEGAELVLGSEQGKREGWSRRYFEVRRGHDVLASISPPWAVGADGEEVPVTYEAVGNRLRMTVAHRGADVAYPVVVDPVIEDFQYWTEKAASTGKYNSTLDFVNWGFGASPSNDHFWHEKYHQSHGRGLYVVGYGWGAYQAGQFGQWSFKAPGTSYIYRAEYGYVKHDPGSGGSQVFEFISTAQGAGESTTWCHPRPHEGGDGVCGSSPWWSRDPQHYNYKSHCVGNMINQTCPESGGSAGNQMVVGLYMLGPTNANGAWVFMGGAKIFLADRDNPTVSGLSHTNLPNAWVKSLAPRVTFNLRDTGLGLKRSALESTAGWVGPAIESGCTGDRNSRCLTDRPGAFHDYSSETSYFGAPRLPEGTSNLRVRAWDVVDNQGVSPTWQVRIDRSNPNSLALGGEALSSSGIPKGESRTLTVDASDQFSGVKRYEVTVGTNPTLTHDRGCTASAGCGSGAAPRQSFTISTASLGYGQHPVTVRVEDAVGNHATVRGTVTVVDRTPPTLQVTGGLREPLPSSRRAEISASDPGGTGIGRIDVWLNPPPTPTSQTAIASKTDCPTATTDCTWSFELPYDTPPGMHTLLVRAADRAGNTSADVRWNVLVVDLRRGEPAKLGLEEWYAYDRTAAGADSDVFVNGETGNVVWHQVPVVTPGRGLSTAVNLTYNSQDRGGLLGTRLLDSLPVIEWGAPAATPLKDDLASYSYAEAGVGVSVGISGPTRVNEPLGGVLLAQAVEESQPGLVSPLPLPATDEGLTIALTDADGTRHTFVKRSGAWQSPRGLNLRLRRHSSGGGLTQLNPRKWAMTRRDGVTHYFDNFGYLRSTEDRNGNLLRYEYEAYNALGGPEICAYTDPIAGTTLPTVDAIGRRLSAGKLCALRVVRVLDPAHSSRTSRALQVAYRDVDPLGQLVDGLVEPTNTSLVGATAGRIRSITDLSGREYRFTYGDDPGQDGPAGHLIAFTEAAGSGDARTTRFVYEDDDALGGLGNDRLLTAVIEQRGDCAATHAPDCRTSLTYPSRTRVVSAISPPRRATGLAKRGGGPKRFDYTAPGAGVQRTFDAVEREHAAAGARPLKELLTRYRMDTSGRPTEVVAPDGTRTLLTWDLGDGVPDDNKVRRVVEGLAPGEAPAVGVAEPAGSDQRTTEYTYDSANDTGVLLERREYSAGTSSPPRTTSFAYRFGDGTGTAGTDCTQAAGGSGHVADLVAINRPKVKTGWAFCVDGAGNVRRRTDARDYFTETAYGSNGVIASETDEQGDVTVYPEHHATGQPTQAFRPTEAGQRSDFRAWQYRYDPRGNVTEVIDPRGRTAPSGQYTTTLTYDAFDRLRSETRPKLSSAQQTITRSWVFDRNGNLTEAQDGEKRSTTLAHTPDDQLRTLTRPGPNVNNGPKVTTGFVYDDAGRRIAVVGARGFTSQRMSVAASGHRDACEGGVIAPVAFVTRSCVDAAGRQVAEVRYAPAQDVVGERHKVTSFSHDRRGNLTGVIDPRRNQKRSISDAIVAARDGSQRRESVSYNDFDEPTVALERPTELGASQTLRRFEYDANGNQTHVHHPNAPAQTILVYDHRDQLITSTDPLGRTTCVKRRKDGRATAITTPRGVQDNGTRCANGNPDDHYPHFTTRLTYDKVGDLSRRTLPFAPQQYGRSTSDLQRWTVEYRRNAVGDPETIVDARDNSDGTADNPIRNTFYDSGELRSTNRPSWWHADWGDDHGLPRAGDRYRGGEAADMEVAVGGPRIAEREGPSANAEASDDEAELPEGLGWGDFGRVDPQPLPNLLPQAGVRDTTFQYDNEMRLSLVTDAAGKRRQIEYYDNGAVRRKTLPYKSGDPIDHQFGYDEHGNLTTSKSVGVTVNGTQTDLTTTFTYDEYDRLAEERTPGALSDAGDQVIADEVTRLRYDINDNVRWRETPRGTRTATPDDDHAFEYQYDSLDRLVAEANPARERWSYHYDVAHRRAHEVRPRGQGLADQVPYTRDLGYDAADQLRTITERVRDQGDLQTLVTSLDYDDDGQQSKVTAPGAESAGGQMLSRVSETVYDGRGYPWKSSRGVAQARRTTITEYDANGNLRRIVQPKGVTTNDIPAATDNGTDTSANLTSASKNATVREYDQHDLLVKVRLPWNDDDARKFVQVFKRSDDLHRITSLISPHETNETHAPRTSYRYHPSDWIESVTDEKLTRVARPEPVGERHVTYDYDKRGIQTEWEIRQADDIADSRRVTRTLFPNGTLRTRTARQSTPGGDRHIRRYRYFYNRNRSLTSFFDDEKERVTRIERDPAERETAIDEEWSGGRDTLFSYDRGGNLAARKTDGTLGRGADGQPTYGGSEAKETTFDFDELDRETSMEVKPASGSTRITTTRWWPSRELRARAKGDGVARDADTVDRWLWTSRGLKDRHERVHGPTSGRTTATTTYSYDDNDNRTTDERGTYAYNPRDQVVRWTRSGNHPVPARRNTSVRYTLRGDGAIKTKDEYTSGSSPQLSSRSSYDYQGEGERLRSVTTRHYSPAGSPTASATDTATYSYNSLGSLTRVLVDRSAGELPPIRTNPDDAPEICTNIESQAAPGETLYCHDEFQRLKFSKGLGQDAPADIHYDALDRRDRKVPYTATGTGPSRDYSYIGTSEMLSREVDSGSRRAYDYDSRGDRQGVQTTSGTSVSYRPYAKDANGSVVGIENATTGAVAANERYLYDPYGEQEKITTNADTEPEKELSTAAQDNPFRFQGFYYDADIKTYDMHARHYRPDIGRFLSADLYADALGDLALQSDPLTQNRYTFAGANPVTNVEFDGHKVAGNHDLSEPYTDDKGATRGRQNAERRQAYVVQRTVRHVVSKVTGEKYAAEAARRDEQAASRAPAASRNSPLDYVRNTISQFAASLSPDPLADINRQAAFFRGPVASIQRDMAALGEGLAEPCRGDSGPLYCTTHIFVSLGVLRGAGSAATAARAGTAAKAEDALPIIAGGAQVATKSQRIKQAMLPNRGRIRYVPPKRWNPNDELPQGPSGGYLDRFGNEWVRGPSRTAGESFEWDVQLSQTGRNQIGWLSRSGTHVNVNRRGEVTHR